MTFPMIEFDWKITVGNVIEVATLGGSGLWFLWRVCLRFDRVEQEVKALQGQQDERKVVQDQRHAENLDAIRAIQSILMGPRR